MNHNDHVRLLRKGIPTPGGIWADLGSGGGAFTLALADLIGPTGHIYSVDKDQSSLREQERAMHANFPAAKVDYINADFTRPQRLPQLDGIIMANSLHYVRKKEPVLELVRSYLKPGGHFILVEYNADRGNPWVPYPLSYSTWEALARQNAFHNTALLERVPSRFLNEIYSALSIV
jgi:ubiquinone/menaquinone biosynthesis C-methylase UbiE